MEKLKKVLEGDDVLIVAEEGETNIRNCPKWDSKKHFYINSSDLVSFKKLYYLYEFDDRISNAFENISNYPTLFNYVNTGILTISEIEELFLK